MLLTEKQKKNLKANENGHGSLNQIRYWQESGMFSRNEELHFIRLLLGLPKATDKELEELLIENGYTEYVQLVFGGERLSQWERVDQGLIKIEDIYKQGQPHDPEVDPNFDY